ncbi:MAG: thioredoxin family protein [Octadecabacter sp.]|nr:thioredoxin family protein [Octadecabacter sp.]
MKRREFLIAAGAVALVPMAATAAPIAYVEGLLQERLDAGETVFLDFKASWCTTCRAQGRIIEDLKAANPAFEENITFIDVDWDEFGRSEIVERFNVPRRSTLIVLKGDQELGRIVAGTAHRDIEALMNTALDAATA